MSMLVDGGRGGGVDGGANFYNRKKWVILILFLEGRRLF
jgi:hypothetical protein